MCSSSTGKMSPHVENLKVVDVNVSAAQTCKEMCRRYSCYFSPDVSAFAESQACLASDWNASIISTYRTFQAGLGLNCFSVD